MFNDELTEESGVQELIRDMTELCIMDPMSVATNLALMQYDVALEVWTKILHNKEAKRVVKETIMKDSPSKEIFKHIFCKTWR